MQITNVKAVSYASKGLQGDTTSGGMSEERWIFAVLWGGKQKGIAQLHTLTQSQCKPRTNDPLLCINHTEIPHGKNISPNGFAKPFIIKDTVLSFVFLLV